jgi:calcineurin-like phosphoesterase family protein
MVWFTADFHLGHSNIIRYCEGPFSSTTEMDEEILSRVNESIKPEDELYFLGDFCIGGPKVALAYRQRIRCKRIYFVLGNHDRVIRKIEGQFAWVKEIAEVNIRQQPIVLCHYAMRVWHQSGRGAWQIYGHSHGKLPSAEGSSSMDVGVDTNAFRPYSFVELQSGFAVVRSNAETTR